MKNFGKKVFATAGYNTIFMGSGRKEFNPKKNQRPFEDYLQECAQETLKIFPELSFDEGVIGSFMSSRFINQANLPGFLPFMIPSLGGKPCFACEGACGTGGRAIGMGIRSILSGTADSVFVTGFEMQNSMKAVYGQDVLAGAAYYSKERKTGDAFFFPGIFAKRAQAYYDQFGYQETREAMATWYEQSIKNARLNPKAQEYHNRSTDLFSQGMQEPNPASFIPHLNFCDCSKVSDGASSLVLLSEEGVKKAGVKSQNLIEIVGLGEAQADITQDPKDLTELSTTRIAAKKAFDMAGITNKELSVLELHDCFTITALLALEALGFSDKGKAAYFVLNQNTAKDGAIPTNLSGGLGGFGHPTGASGVRQLVDLIDQLTGKAANQRQIRSPFGMMVSMGGNDKTVTSLIAKASNGFD